MNTYNKIPLALFAAISAGTVVQQTEARQRIHITDPFWDSAWFDDAISQQRQAMDEMHAYFKQQLPSKEQQDAIKKARENLANIKLEVKEADQKISILLSGFSNLEKKDVEIEKKKYGWAGTITTKDGIIEFAISARGIELTRHAEVKFEEKTATDPKAVKENSKAKETTEAKADDAKKEVKAEKEQSEAQQIFYSSSYTSEALPFKKPININSLKVDTRTATSLTLSADKIKKETLHIP